MASCLGESGWASQKLTWASCPVLPHGGWQRPGTGPEAPRTGPGAPRMGPEAPRWDQRLPGWDQRPQDRTRGPSTGPEGPGQDKRVQDGTRGPRTGSEVQDGTRGPRTGSEGPGWDQRAQDGIRGPRTGPEAPRCDQRTWDRTGWGTVYEPHSSRAESTKIVDLRTPGSLRPRKIPTVAHGSAGRRLESGL